MHIYKNREVSLLFFAQVALLAAGLLLGLCFSTPQMVFAFAVGALAYLVPHMVASVWYFHYRGASQVGAMLRALLGGQLLKWAGLALGISIGMHSSMKATLLGFVLMMSAYWCLPFFGARQS